MGERADEYARDLKSLTEPACRYCRHEVRIHSFMQGCAACKCNASQSEARPVTDEEMFTECLAPGHYLVPWQNPNLPTPTRTRVNAPRKATDMKSPERIQRELREIDRAAELLEARRASLLGEAEKIAALPDEPVRNTVISFNVQHDPHGIVYKYVAFRSNRNGASWHTTSKSRSGPYTWGDMLNLMMSDVSVKTGARTLEFFQYDDSGQWVR